MVIGKFKTTTKSGENLETIIPGLAKSTLLKKDDVKMWFEHLQLVQKRRQKGAQKAKEIRAKNAAGKKIVLYEWIGASRFDLRIDYMY